MGQGHDTTKRVCWEQLSERDRYKIEALFQQGLSSAEIGQLTSKELQRIEDWVNNYPRRIFGYKSANQMAA